MKNNSNSTLIEKIASFIVDRRKAFFIFYILMVVFSIFSSGWVKVNNTITDYLSEETETRRGIKMMEDEFTTYASCKIMVDNISYKDAELLCEELKNTKGVKDIAFDDTESHYHDASALYSVTFSCDDKSEICKNALDDLKNKLDEYDIYVSAQFGDTKADNLAKELSVILPLSALIIIAVLFFTSRTYMEIPVLLITFLIAAILNKGTNFIFGTISFVSDSIAIILQLALAIDYAIILCHRYLEEREKKNPHDAVVSALCSAIPEIAGSCLTTLSGLAAMSFMHFKLGYDMSIVLIKAIIISILTVFTLMPGLLYSFSALIDKTHHKNFVPKITKWGHIVVRLKYIAPAVFAALAIIGFFLSNNCPYAYSYTNLSTLTKNEAQIADEMIKNTFKNSNQVAVLIPSGDSDKELKLKTALEKHNEIDSVTSLSGSEALDGYLIGDKLTPREFSELIDIDIEKVRLIYSAYALDSKNYGKIIGGIDNYRISLLDMFDFLYEEKESGAISLDEDMSDAIDEINEKLTDGKKQLSGPKHSRLVLELNLPEESEETFQFLNTIRKDAQKFYGNDVTLVGNSTNDSDLSSTFGQDNILISILSVLFVMLVLFFTFQSAGLPFILILVIQGSIWINFSFPTLENNPLYFMSYLVVNSIQMGANIDYAIVITNRYQELRKDMSSKDAVIAALDLAFPTIFTSGTIMASAGFIIGSLTSDPAISSIGICLGRGTLISIILVMGILPQLLMLFDKFIEKTSFSVKSPIKHEERNGNVFMDGHIHGYVNGRVDGVFTGMINGEVNANIINEKQEKGDDK